MKKTSTIFYTFAVLIMFIGFPFLGKKNSSLQLTYFICLVFAAMCSIKFIFGSLPIPTEKNKKFSFLTYLYGTIVLVGFVFWIRNYPLTKELCFTGYCSVLISLIFDSNKMVFFSNQPEK